MRRSADIGRPAAVAVLVTAVVALAAPAASPRSQGVEKRRFPSRDWAYALALQRDGKIVAVGRSLGGGWRFALARYTPAGKLDPSFGDSGKVLSDFGSGGTANAVAVQRDGKVVAAGQTWVARPEDVLVRYTPRGHLDPAFGQGGKVLTDFGALATSVAIQADGRIVVAGASGRRFALARYTARGRPDASFGRNGEVLTRLGAYAQAQAVAIQRDGKVVAAGSARSGFALARYTARGRPDASFGSGGTVVTKLGSFSLLSRSSRTASWSPPGRPMISPTSGSSATPPTESSTRASEAAARS